MTHKRLGRYATALTSVALLGALVVAAPVAAKNPSWYINYSTLPSVVGAGHDAGYFITVGNNGPSNINTLTMTVTPVSTPTAAPTYFSGLTWNFGPHGSCTNTGPLGTGPLTCDLGTVEAGQFITFTVAFLVPTGSSGTFDVDIAIQSGSGNTGSDGGSSRGDAKTVTATTAISSSANFDGGFSVDGDTYQTTGNLGRNNKQTTTLEVTDATIPVTVTDGIASYPCTSTDGQCSRLIGEWSVLDVNGGVNTDLIKVTLMIWGGSVPGGVGVGDIYLLHADGSGGYTTVDATCDSATAPTNADCLVSVTKVGNNFKIVAWFTHNGGARGAY